MKIKEIPKELRPREKFLEKGIEFLTDPELLAIILRTGIRGENIIDISNKLIESYGIENLFRCSIYELTQIKGIGKGKAMQILAISEIVKRCEEKRKKQEIISNAKDVFDIFNEKLKNELQEHFFVVLLDTKNRILKKVKISTGILDASIIHPREIFRDAIKNSCCRIILVHNHPSGDPMPSSEDLNVTEKLIKGGNLIGIEVIDHVIIGYNDYWSYSET